MTGEFPAQKPVTRSFDIFFDLCLNKRLSKQSWGWWFETPWHPIWRHCNVVSACSYYDLMPNKGNRPLQMQMMTKFHGQRAHDAITTELWRQNDVATSFWCHNEVIIASCARWDICIYPFYVGLYVAGFVGCLYVYIREKKKKKKTLEANRHHTINSANDNIYQCLITNIVYMYTCLCLALLLWKDEPTGTKKTDDCRPPDLSYSLITEESVW